MPCKWRTTSLLFVLLLLAVSNILSREREESRVFKTSERAI